jgi:hypothetical protein
MGYGILSPEQKTRLADLYTQTNLRQSREEIYRAIEQLWQMPVPNNNKPKEAVLLR